MHVCLGDAGLGVCVCTSLFTCMCVCVCVWSFACFTLMLYKDIIILLHGSYKLKIFHKAAECALLCIAAKLHFRMMRENSHFMKRVTAVGQQNSKLLSKLNEEIVT